MQSPRFNLDDVNDSIVIFFLLFSQMAEWRRGGGGWGGGLERKRAQDVWSWSCDSERKGTGDDCCELLFAGVHSFAYNNESC